MSKIDNLLLNNPSVSISENEFTLIKDEKSDKYYSIIPQSFIEDIEILNTTERDNLGFVKSTIDRIEYQSTVRNDYEFETDELKKRMLGMFLIDEIDEKVDYNNSKYIKFSSLPQEEKFVMLIGNFSEMADLSRDFIIQNVKSRQLYVISSYAATRFINDRAKSPEDRYLLKKLPRELTQKEKETISRFKTLLKKGEQKGKFLHSIQKKYTTARGYFDPSRVSSSDKSVFNKNLQELKDIYEQLKDIFTYENKKGIIYDNISVDDSATYDLLKDWYYNVHKIN